MPAFLTVAALALLVLLVRWVMAVRGRAAARRTMLDIHKRWTPAEFGDALVDEWDASCDQCRVDGGLLGRHAEHVRDPAYLGCRTALLEGGASTEAQDAITLVVPEFWAEKEGGTDGQTE